MTNQPIVPPVVMPGVTAPLGAAPAPPVPPPTRYRLKYGVLECVTCGLAKDYCKGHAPSPSPSQDGADSSLIARIRDCAGGR